LNNLVLKDYLDYQLKYVTDDCFSNCIFGSAEFIVIYFINLLIVCSLQYNAISLISMHREAPYLQYSFDILYDNYGIYIVSQTILKHNLRIFNRKSLY